MFRQIIYWAYLIICHIQKEHKGTNNILPFYCLYWRGATKRLCVNQHTAFFITLFIKNKFCKILKGISCNFIVFIQQIKKAAWNFLILQAFADTKAAALLMINRIKRTLYIFAGAEFT